MCNDGVENELHALLEFTLYSDIRQTLLTTFVVKYVFYCFTKEKQMELIIGCNEILVTVPKPAMIY